MLRGTVAGKAVLRSLLKVLSSPTDLWWSRYLSLLSKFGGGNFGEFPGANLGYLASVS